LQRNVGWQKYFKAVYGEVPQVGYPLCIGDFRVLYTAELRKAGIRTPAASKCPKKANTGAYFTQMHGDQKKQFPGVNFILQRPPYKALPQRAWVEIAHHNENAQEVFGSWFYYMKGTGIWFNLGKTVSFGDHPAAYKYFKVHAKGKSEAKNTAMSRNAAASGYDSIQFLNHNDHGTCGPCCQRLHLSSINVEIVGVKLKGTLSCAEPSGGGAIRAGWMGGRACNCREGGNGYFINCQSVPPRLGDVDVVTV